MEKREGGGGGSGGVGFSEKTHLMLKKRHSRDMLISVIRGLSRKRSYPGGFWMESALSKLCIGWHVRFCLAV